MLKLLPLWFFCISLYGQSTILRIGNGIEPQDLDPQRSTGMPEFAILSAVFEGLVVLHPKTLKPLPGTASSWTTSKDGLTWTFNLRKDAKWSNGEPITANDFVYSWRRLVDPKTAAPLASMAKVIVNAEAIQKGDQKDLNQLGVEAPAPDKLVVHLSRPAPFLLQLVNHNVFFPVHQKTIEKFKGAWTKPENMVSNGAFRLAEWRTNKVLRVTKREDYWDASHVKLTEVQFFPGDPDTAEALFKTGKLDISDFPQQKVPQWRADKSGVLQSSRANAVAFYLFNVNVPPLNDVRVRKALSLAIDRKQLIDKVVRGGQTPLRSFTPEKLGDYAAVPKVPTDLSRLAEAKKLLAAAGFGPEKKANLEITINKSDLNSQIAEAIQFMWKKNLDVDAKINVMEWKVYLDAAHNRNFQVTRAAWVLDYEDPEAYLESFVSDSSSNEAGYKNAEFDKLFQEAVVQVDYKKRLKKFQQAEALMMDEMPIMPLYETQFFYLKRPEVDGYFANSQQIHALKFVSIH